MTALKERNRRNGPQRKTSMPLDGRPTARSGGKLRAPVSQRALGNVSGGASFSCIQSIFCTCSDTKREEFHLGHTASGSQLHISCQIQTRVALSRKRSGQRTWRPSDPHRKGRELLFSFGQISCERVHGSNYCQIGKFSSSIILPIWPWRFFLQQEKFA